MPTLHDRFLHPTNFDRAWKKVATNKGCAGVDSCLGLKIPVIFLSQLGEYKGHLWSAAITDLTVEARQFERQQEPDFGVKLARAIVAGKLLNKG